MWELPRRKAAASIAGITLGSGALVATQTDRATADVTGEFSIPPVDKETTQAVNSLRLSVDGQLSIDSDTRPDKVVLRLEVARSGAFEQLAAEAWTADLSRDFTESFSFDRVNLLDHSRIPITDASPTDVGETATLELVARLSVTAKHEGDILAQSELQEPVSIEITKSKGQTTVQLGATGEIVVGTSEPQA